MKKLLFLGIILSLLFVPKAHAAYTYYRTITVTSTGSVASGTLNNFPFLFNTTANFLKTTSTDAVNGRIQNVNAYDVVFASSTPTASGSNWSCNKLPHEIEKYTSSTGEMVAWFKAPTTTVSSLYYMCYGDNTITSTQEASSSVWDANFKVVQHLGDNLAAKNVVDSTNVNPGTAVSNTNTYSTSTKIGSGFYNNASPGTGITQTSLTLGAPFTIYAWVKPNALSGFQNIYAQNGAQGYWINGTVMELYPTSNALTALATSTWNQVGVSYDTSSNKTNFFNGATDGTQNVSYSTTTWNGSICDSGTGSECLLGYLDELEVSSIVRSTSWILTEYNNQNSPSTFYAVGAETSGTAAAGASAANSVSLSSLGLGLFNAASTFKIASGQSGFKIQ